MSLTAVCPQCSRSYSVPEDRAGRRFKCAGCQAVVTVPSRSRAAVTRREPALNQGRKTSRASTTSSSASSSISSMGTRRLPPIHVRSSTRTRTGRSKGPPAGKPLFGSVWLDALAWGLGGVTAASLVVLTLGYGGVYLSARLQQQTTLVPERKNAVPLKKGAIPASSVSEGTQAGQVWEGNGLKMKFCWCPAGTFTLGSPAAELGRGADEEPREAVLGSGFWIGKFEVTQAEYEAIIGENPSRLTPYSFYRKDKPPDVPEDQARNFPVDMVTYGSAEAFCIKLTARERREGRLPEGWEYSLPSETEWEYACRAGTTGATPFGDKLASAQANFDGTHPYNGAAAGKFLKEPQPVGSYPANTWGVCDTLGNVREWCQDFYTAQPGGGAALGDRQPLEVTQQRVIRGGDYQSPGTACRSASRSKGHIDQPDFRLGFRIVLARTKSH